jgi:hypothetical protein
MNQNPYASPSPAAATPDRQEPSYKSVFGMYARHLIFVLLLYATMVVGGSMLESYVVSAKIPRLAAPSLLVLHLGRSFAKTWHYLLILAPLYYLFLIAVTAADNAVVGVRRAWSVIFWAFAILFTAAIGFGFVLPFL